jgi:hypothetical protein
MIFAALFTKNIKLITLFPFSIRPLILIVAKRQVPPDQILNFTVHPYPHKD